MRDTPAVAPSQIRLRVRGESKKFVASTLKRASILLSISLAILFSFAQPIFAHPADQIYVVATFDADPAELRIHVQLQLGPLVAAPLWAQADRDQNGKLDAAELNTWLPQFTERNFAVQVDGVRVPLHAQADHIADFSAFRSATSQPQIELTLRTPVAVGQHVVVFSHQLNKQGGGFRADVQSTAHSAFTAVTVEGMRASTLLDTTPLQTYSIWQWLLMWLGLGSMLAAVVTGTNASLNAPTASANKRRRTIAHSRGQFFPSGTSSLKYFPEIISFLE